MKNRVVSLLVVMTMAFLGGCRNQEKTPEPTQEQTEQEKTSTEETAREETQKETEGQKSSLLTGTYKVPLKDIYIDTPNYHEVEEGYMQIFTVPDTKYVAISTQRKKSPTNVTEAHEMATEILIKGMSSHDGGVNSINITEDEVIDVNGIEVYSFEGTINYGRVNIHDGWAKGYSFIMDGIPCQIIGSVTDDSQSQEMIDEIDEIVTAMMESVRSEE